MWETVQVWASSLSVVYERLRLGGGAPKPPGSLRQTDRIFWIQWFLDRWYGSDRKAVFPGQRVILAIPFEDSTLSTPQHAVGMLTEALNDVDAEVLATLLAPGVHRRGEVRQRADRTEAARTSVVLCTSSETRTTLYSSSGSSRHVLR